MSASIQSVPLADLFISNTGSQAERRQRFDKAALGELAESIKTVGLLQPLVVRAMFRKDGSTEGFQIVAGERRFLAAKTAGLGEISCNVRELTDDQVLEVQLIENLQREDIHELAEAEGYEGLMKLGHSAEAIADKVGKSKAYVYGRLKLTALCKAARAAFYEGDLTASTALLIARVPGEDQQQRALKHITEKDWHGRPMSYRDALRYIQETFHLKLSDAPFQTEDVTLVPAAGACGACPMRTGNQPELFGDVKGADVCTNPQCFQSKKAAHIKRQLEKAKASGDAVIRGADAKRILPNANGYSWSNDGAHKQLRNGFARPSDQCLTDPKKRTYAELAGKDAPKVLIQHPDTGRIEKIFKIEDIKDKLQAKGVKVEKPAADHKESQQRDREADELRAKQEIAERQAIFAACLKAAPSAVPHATIAALVAEVLGNGGGHDMDSLFKLLGWGKAPPYLRTSVLMPKLTAMRPADLNRLASVVPFFDCASDTYGDMKPLEALAKTLGLDAKKIRAGVAPEIKPKPVAKKAPAKKK